jgi:hypothetical protein
LDLSEIAQLNPIKPGKRFRERFQLKCFIDQFPEFPAGEQEWDREEPDLIVRKASGRLGLEHTTLYTDDSRKGSRKKIQEGLQWKLVESALTKYAKTELPPVSSEVWFDVAVPITEKSYGGVADALAHATQNIVSMPEPRHRDDITRREYERHFGDPLPREILRIRLRREPRTQYVVWYASQPWDVSELRVSSLQERIRRKELRLPYYQKSCDELWLLIASEGVFPSSNFGCSEELRSHAFRTRFDRVFYFDSFKGEILELKKES